LQSPQLPLHLSTPEAESSSLELTLRALRPILEDPAVTEICINRPGEGYVERLTGWERTLLPFAEFDWCMRLGKLVANATKQSLSAERPILSGWLPRGERIQIVLPPATTANSVSITIRKPSQGVLTLSELEAKGLFDPCVPASDALDDTEVELLALLQKGAYRDFLRLAIQSRKNIVVSGPTGSGKTTFTKALTLDIPPYERLITIEDAKELVLDQHPNHVRLYYSKDGQGQARITAKQLLESCLRMRPDRILLAELRSDEAYYYLRNINSGHPGSITSVHASSARLAFEQLMLLVKESPGGNDLRREDIKSLLFMLVDVVVQFGMVKQQRFVKEIWYDPSAKRQHVH